MSTNNFSCATDEHDNVFDQFRGNQVWNKETNRYTLTASCSLAGCIASFCTDSCASDFCSEWNAFNYSGGFVCRNDPCLHPYYFMERNQTLCDLQSCGGFQVKRDSNKEACIYDLARLQDFYLTNGSVWNQTSAGILERL